MNKHARCRTALGFAFTLALLPLSAQGMIAQNGMQVQQTASSDIAVAYRSDARETDYWCAAGDYAMRVLRLPNTTRLYRASAKPRGQGQGILFTLDPARKAEGAGLSSFGSGPRDGGISVAMAVGSYCRIINPFERF